MLRSIIFGGLVAGLTLFVVGSAFHVLVPVAAPGIPPQFRNPALFRPWAGWTSSYMALHPFAYGFVFAAGYLSLRRWSAFPPGIRGGLAYGAGVFLVGSLPVFLLFFAAVTITPELTMCWIFQNMIQYLLAGMLLAYCCDRQVRETTTQVEPQEPPASLGFVAPRNTEWIEHPVVVINSRVLLYHPPMIGFGKVDLVVVEDSEADYCRYWVSINSWQPVKVMIGQPVGFEFTLESMKGPNQYKVLAIHVPRDGRTFRSAELG